MPKKKLLVFHPIIAPYRIDFFNEFNMRYDTRVCLFKRNLSSQKFDYAKIEEQFNFVPTYIEKNSGFFHWIKGLLRQLREFNPDIVLCSEFGFATLLVVVFKILTFKKYRIINIVDDSYNMVAEGNQFSWKHVWATRMLMPFMDNVINVEPRVAEYYKRHYGKGVYMPIIVDDDLARERLQRILPLSQKYVEQYNLVEKKVLLFVGRHVKIKNLSFAIQAFVKANIKDSVFVIVGDGPEKNELIGLANNHTNIIFTGRLEGDELYAWYNVAQVFTLPSILEPFGAVTNEALLGGCNALVSKLAGSNCLVKENVNGNIIDPYNKNLCIEFLKQSFSNAKPITLPLQLRNNNMNETFKDCFERMLNQIS